jgi:hypothetical protein
LSSEEAGVPFLGPGWVHADLNPEGSARGVGWLPPLGDVELQVCLDRFGVVGGRGERHLEPESVSRALQRSGDPLGGGWVELPPGGEPFGGGELDSLDLERVAGGLEDDAAAAAWRPGEPALVCEVAAEGWRVDDDGAAGVGGFAEVPNHVACQSRRESLWDRGKLSDEGG